MDWSLPARLLHAHTLGDFVLQPDRWVADRNRRHFGSPYLYAHGVIHFILAAGFSFLMAAKSVLRFGDLREAKDKGHTEYVLIGTLLSFGLALATGLIIKSLLTHLAS